MRRARRRRAGTGARCRWRICADYDTGERPATLQEEFLAGTEVDDAEAFSAQDTTNA
ncbi:hypothetical protein ACWEIJ_15580 [Lentzea sp. NPDC004789]